MTTQKPNSQKKIYALIIEDDVDAAFISRKALQDNGYHTEIITRGDDAAEKLKTLKPDLILLDLHLPVVTGVELLAQVRQADHLKETKVVLVTADPRTADTIEADADMLLLKPVTYSQVRGLVQRVMRGATGELPPLPQ